MTEEEKIVLFYFVDTMEAQGVTVKGLHIIFSPETVEEMNKKYSKTITFEKTIENLNRLLSHEYVKRASLGNAHLHLSITSKGLGVVNSLRKKEEDLKNRSILKKLSDYIEDHKGLFVLLGSIGLIITLILKFKGN